MKIKSEIRVIKFDKQFKNWLKHLMEVTNDR